MSLWREILTLGAQGRSGEAREIIALDLRLSLCEFPRTAQAGAPFRGPLPLAVKRFRAKLPEHERALVQSLELEFVDYLLDDVLDGVSRPLQLIEVCLAYPNATLSELVELFPWEDGLKRAYKWKEEWITDHLRSLVVAGIPLPGAILTTMSDRGTPRYEFNEVAYAVAPERLKLSWNDFKRRQGFNAQILSIADEADGAGVADEGVDYGLVPIAEVVLKEITAQDLELEVDLQLLGRRLSDDLAELLEKMHGAKPGDGYRLVAWHNVFWNLISEYVRLRLSLTTRDPLLETDRELADHIKVHYPEVKSVSRPAILRRRQSLSAECLRRIEEGFWTKFSAEASEQPVLSIPTMPLMVGVLSDFYPCKDLGSDKVFDLIGRLFEGVSIKDYLENAVTDEGADEAVNKIEGKLTKEQVEALRERERRLYGDGGDVKRELPRLTEYLELEQYRRLLPGYVRHFIEKAAPQLGLELSGDLGGYFALNPTPDAPEILTELLEVLPPELCDKLTVHRPDGDADAVFVHPGGTIYETLRGCVVARFAEDALRGATFIDPAAKRPYLFHLALLAINRQSDPQYRELARTEALEYRLVGLKQEEGGVLEFCPAGQPLLLKGGQGLAPSALNLVASVRESVETARRYVNEHLAPQLVERHRQTLYETLPARVEFIRRGFGYQEAELAAARSKLRDKANAGSKGAKAELTKVKEHQGRLKDRREEAIAVLQREPELISAAEVIFLAHALVVLSNDPDDQKRHDAQVEAIAVRAARAYEESLGAVVQDVSMPATALAAGLEERPGFDLLSTRPGASPLCIEVKGRASVGDIELTENEWVKACNLREQYWLYVVYDCASAQPRLLRVQDPFHKLLFRAKGGVVIDEQEIFGAAQ